MPNDASVPSELPDYASGFTASGSPLLRLTGDLERWGTLFRQVLQSQGAAAAEQVLGGLVEWMGNDLLDGWMYLAIPLFEELSDLSEELFRASGDYLAWARQEPGPNPHAARLRHEERLRVALERVRALAKRG